MKTTPKHFASSWSFTNYILDVALRDRCLILEGIVPRYREPEEDEVAHIAEVKAEISAIKARIKKHAKKRPTE